MSRLDQRWLERVKRLQALAATGLHYTDGEYDRERYEEINQITILMLAELAEVPVERIEGLVPESSGGYATPLVDVRSAVLYEKSPSIIKCEYVWKRTDAWINFPWSTEEPILDPARGPRVLDA